MENQKWVPVQLKDICSRIDYGYTASACNEPVGPRFLRITDIVHDLLDWDTVPFCEIDRSKKRKYLLKDGDIVVARTGATTGYAKAIKDHPESVFASYLVRLRVQSGISSDFVGHIVQSDQYKQFIKKNLSGSAQPQANAKVLTSFRLNLPPRPVQDRIANILSAYDDLIENNTRRIKILEEMAQRIYREWFVYFRFPGRENIPLVPSDLGPIPRGWRVRDLYSIATPTYGFPFKSKQFFEGSEGMPVVRIRDIRSDHTGTRTREGAKSKYLIRDGDILIGMDGDFHMGKWAGGPAYLNQRVVMFRRSSPLPQYHLFLALKDPIGHLNSTIVGTTVAHLSARDLKAIQLVIPDEERLALSRETFDPIFDLELNLKKRNANLRATRDLLLPKLISGEIPVEAAEDAGAELMEAMV